MLIYLEALSLRHLLTYNDSFNSCTLMHAPVGAACCDAYSLAHYAHILLITVASGR